MLQKPKCPVIALEEHYWDEELAAHAKGVERNPGITQRLFDLGELRLKEMDEAGIDIQVISHGAPSAQKLTGSDAAAIAARANDRLAAAVKAKPDRQAWLQGRHGARAHRRPVPRRQAVLADFRACREA
jgi:hypothetical protein